MTTTTEYKLHSSDKAKLLQALQGAGFANYVDSAFDGLNLNPEEAAEEIDSLLEQEHHLPICYYFLDSDPEEERFLALLASLSSLCHWEAKTYDSIVWEQAWESQEESFTAGSLEVIVNPQEGVEPHASQIFIHAKGAFGSGQHATTKAILEELLAIKTSSDQSLLDVGTGTGILAIAAEKLGMTRVVATDIEESAIQSAMHNRAQNGCRFQVIHDSLPHTIEKFDLVVSNILPPVVNDLIPEFCRYLADEGRLILAGFNQSNLDRILEDVARLSLEVSHQTEVRGWIALTLKPLA